MQYRIEKIWIDLKEELYRFIFSKVKNEQDAQDILQDVFIKIHTNINTVKQTSKLTPWIYQVTRNTIIDHYRKQKNTIVQPVNFDLSEEANQDFDYSHLSECVNGKIENLAQEYKEAIVLTYLRDFSQKQLAEHIQLSYSGAKSRVQKAKTILKGKILDCPNVELDDSGNILEFGKKT